MDPTVQSQAREWLMMLTMWAFFGYALYLITVTLRRKQRNAMQQHVLDKFASAKDFADFVQSPAGQKYVMSFADTATSSKSAILNSVRTGVVLLFTGMAQVLVNAVRVHMDFKFLSTTNQELTCPAPNSCWRIARRASRCLRLRLCCPQGKTLAHHPRSMFDRPARTRHQF
jgi:hypothetical protein